MEIIATPYTTLFRNHIVTSCVNPFLYPHSLKAPDLFRSNPSTALLHATTDDQDRTSMFDFFGLPRELRDIVYDNLDSPDRRVPLPRAGQQLLCLAIGTAVRNYRLVSQQFNAEYLQRMKNKPTLRIEDRLHNTSDVPDPKVPALVANFTKLQFELYVTCGSDRFMQSDLRCHCDRINFIANQMKCLRALTVHLHVERSHHLARYLESLALQQEIMAEIKGLTELQVSCVSFHGVVENWDYSQTSAPIARWRRDVGLVLCEGLRS